MAHNIQLGAADMNHSIKLRYGCQDLHFETGGDDDSSEDDDEEPGDADALDDDGDDGEGTIGVVVTSNNSVVCMCPTVS